MLQKLTDCFVVPPRKDTFTSRFKLVGNGQSFKLDASCDEFGILFGAKNIATIIFDLLHNPVRLKL